MLAATKRVLALAARTERVQHDAIAAIASCDREPMRHFVGLVGELEDAIDEAAAGAIAELPAGVIRMLVDRVTAAVSIASACSFTLRQLARTRLARGAASKHWPTVEERGAA